ncbi:class I SAM-dependent methyltransferase [Paraglaciecola arctica]|uniref:Methyltransferase domain-containing protein n=1 Tax=Paraglaciecola arctica BSs20135 TaxID=493475 RepID=K6YQD5_9ALTE|nr:class I SAM-dependent methyltransferase [Paraglaciecola arctica]GAC20372.1 hypothetical protein GARC_3414 [Paraglaciecola arctica BSs20135]
MEFDLQQAVLLHKSLQAHLLQTETLVANLVINLKPNSVLNITEINRVLAAIATNNHQVSKALLLISTKLAENNHNQTDPAIKSALIAAMDNSNQIRSWMAAWPQIDYLVRMQVPAKRRKLFHKTTAENDITISQLSAYDSAFEDLRVLLSTNSQGADALNHGCFPDISLPNSVFLENVHAAYRLMLAQGHATQSQFIDVGCGCGMKVLQASKFFNHAVGLEYDEGYANDAQKLLAQMYVQNTLIIHGDGITFDDYKDFNLVYFYRPMRDTELLKNLEDKITSSVTPGTILFAPYNQFFYRHKDLNCAPIGGSLYLAKSTKAQANALRRKAELTGTFFNKPGNPVPSIWDPIIKVSYEKGFGLDNSNKMT